GRGQLHDRFPVGVRHVGHENVARLDFVHFGGIGHDAHLAGTNLLADGATGHQHFPGGLQAVTFLDIVGALLRFDGFGTRLEDVDLAVDAVAAPFDVHGTAVVLLDDDGVAGQFNDFFVGQRIAVALGHRYIDGAHGVAGTAIGVELHLDQLGANATADDGVLAGGQRRLEDVELVGVDRALHHSFAQAVGRRDEDHVLEAGFGV